MESLKTDTNVFHSILDNMFNILGVINFIIKALDKINICKLVVLRINKNILENKIFFDMSISNVDKIFILFLVCLNFQFLFIEKEGIKDYIKKNLLFFIKFYYQKGESSKLKEKIKKVNKLLLPIKIDEYEFAKEEIRSLIINIFSAKYLTPIRESLNKVLINIQKSDLSNIIELSYDCLLIDLVNNKSNAVLEFPKIKNGIKLVETKIPISRNSLSHNLIPSIPFLPQSKSNFLTLVLDLDETLVHNIKVLILLL
jgi:hypothetical protein